MDKLTATNLVRAIDNLPKNRLYNYIGRKNTGQIKIIDISLPEGPIWIKRFDSKKGQTLNQVKKVPISSHMIWRIANALSVNQPINVDRILGGSYNTRSVLEALIAHTPEFFYCYPGRIEDINSRTTIKKGHKHLLWMPDQPHENGKIKEIETDMVISEIPSTEVLYDSFNFTGNIESEGLDIQIVRRHAQIQVALLMIGKQLGFRTWIANNDKGIIYKNKRLIEYEGVVKNLDNEKPILGYNGAIKAALNIDCVWFKNGKLMPAVIEIEHSTGVTSGLVRMKNLKDNFLNLPTRYVIAASDDERDKVVREANKEQFKELNTKFFSYSAIEELYSLCQRRKIKGVTEDFLDCYMESIVS